MLLSENAPADFRRIVTDSIVPQLEAADWRVLSAAKADRLLRELLFDRVYAVRVRGFASELSQCRARRASHCQVI
jgi:hypothetical protein